MKNYQKSFTKTALNIFLETTFELAFGEDSIDKYTMKEVVDRLKDFSVKSHYLEEIMKNDVYTSEKFEYWLNENYIERLEIIIQEQKREL